MPSNKNQAEFSGKWGWMVRNRMRVMWCSLATMLLLALLLGWQPMGLWPLGSRATAALLLLLAGMGLRSWAAGVIHKDGKLATTGPYSLSRHPLYVGSALTIVGLGLACSMVFGFVAVLMAALLYLPTLRNEEQVLAELFSDQWPEYCECTAAVGPKVMPQLKAGWSAKQWLANDEHELLAVLLVLLAVLQWWAGV